MSWPPIAMKGRMLWRLVFSLFSYKVSNTIILTIRRGCLVKRSSNVLLHIILNTEPRLLFSFLNESFSIHSYLKIQPSFLNIHYPRMLPSQNSAFLANRIWLKIKLSVTLSRGSFPSLSYNHTESRSGLEGSIMLNINE